MFISEKIIYTELHKTGGTHICTWLNQLLGGEQVGKHNRVPSYLWDRFILGSIRNPWDWYVSLWAFGCGGQGSVWQQTTRRVDLRYLNRQLHGEMGFNRLHPAHWIRQALQDLRKPVKAWLSSYRGHADPVAFREWLTLMMAPNRRFDMGEGFGFSPVSLRYGLMTYRYLKLFTRLGPEIYNDKSLATSEGVRKAVNENRLVKYIVRNESLEEDLLDALALAGCTVDEAGKAAFLAARQKKTNTSQRLAANFYYNEETVELVASREMLLIDQHGYEPPAVAC